MNDRFKRYFNESIWRRGQSYIDAGRVQNLKKVNRKTYHADVYGDEIYEVEITVEEPIKMSCNCPHAQAGNHCKHMAAVFIAYEKNSLATVDEKSYKDYPWYKKVKSYVMRSGKVKDEYSFAREMNRCLMELSRSKAKWQETLVSLIGMITFMNTLHTYYYDDIMQNIIDQLCETRTQLEEKDAYDHKVAQILPTIMDINVLDYFLDSYFPYEGDNYKILYECLKEADDKMKFYFALAIMRHLIYQEAPEKEVLTIIQPWKNNIHVQEMLCEYYDRKKEYDKAIHIMEIRVFSNSTINEDLIQQKMKLFMLYTKVNRISNRDVLFEQLLKDRRVDKGKLFKVYKNMVSEEEWNTNGRKQLIAWTKNKQRSTKLPIYASLEEGSLIFQELFDGFSIYELDNYANILMAYDPGLLFFMYKPLLKNMLLDAQNDTYSIFHQFRMYYPSSEEAMHAFKYMLLEIKEECKDNQRVVKIIGKIEDRLYEEE